MLKLLASVCLAYVTLFSQEYKVNLIGNDKKENVSFKINFEVDEQNKPITLQKFDIRDLPNIKSLKILTAPGLKGTLADEREVIVYYKTSLEVSGLKIRNLYKTAILRVYGGESELNLVFDKDHYQNITSLLKYHNIKTDIIKDIDNMYGTWDELEFNEISKSNLSLDNNTTLNK